MPAMFWATAGGMGLTGVVTSCTFGLIPVETSRMVVDTTRLADLDAVLARMTEGDAAYRYTGGVDRRARAGPILGPRGADARRPRPARRAAGDRADAAAGLRHRGPVVAAPAIVPGRPAQPVLDPRVQRGLVPQGAAPAHRRDADRSPRSSIRSTWSRDWNRLYGRRGFVQCQCVVPARRRGDAARRRSSSCAPAGAASFLTVLKRFGPGNPGLLSFPTPGWTLAVDIPAVDRRARRGCSTGSTGSCSTPAGALYLAKDARLAPELAAARCTRV